MDQDQSKLNENQKIFSSIPTSFDSNIFATNCLKNIFILNFSPDSGCLQYHTGITGRMETFNFPATQTTAGATGVVGHLPSQQ